MVGYKVFLVMIRKKIVEKRRIDSNFVLKIRKWHISIGEYEGRLLSLF